MYQNYFKFMVEIIVLKGVKTFLIYRKKKKKKKERMEMT